MVIDATNNSVYGLTSLIQSKNIVNRISRNHRNSNNVIQFPNRMILERDVANANMASLGADKITADFTSRMYLHLLLVAGSKTLHRTRLTGTNA